MRTLANLGCLLLVLHTHLVRAGESSPASETASTSEGAPPGAVLMVLSAASRQTLADGSERETGTFLNELYDPYRALVAAGYHVAFATPRGQPPAVDPESLADKYWSSGADRAAARELVASLSPLTLSDVRADPDAYQGIVVPGGQGVMVDLLDDPDLHVLLEAFGSSGRPVGLVCHAPVLLARGRHTAFAGRQVTSVTSIEEWFIETFVMGRAARVRGIGEALDGAGLHHDAGFPGRPHAVRDCNLVTSQNPYSGGPFAGHLIAALADWRRGRRCAPLRADG